MRKRNWIALSALLLASASTALTAQNSPSAKGYAAVTKPSNEVILSFDKPGRVADVLVDMGDQVQAKQLVARLDDTEEQAALAIDKSKADDDTTITAQKKIAEEKAMAAKRMEESGATGLLELKDAQLQAEIEADKIILSTIQHDQDVLKYKQTLISVEKMKLYSPIDGIVAQRILEKGENADGGNMKALVIVQVNPLRIDVPVPIADAAKLKVDQVAEVAFGDRVAKGKITRSAPIGDAASGTVIVRVEVENPDKRKTGEKVFVTFPTDVAAR